ncbi:MAG: quinoprotein dehydrogenase-associated SoxYZ-like carrier, partial [Pseudomonadota bacterium]
MLKQACAALAFSVVLTSPVLAEDTPKNPLTDSEAWTEIKSWLFDEDTALTETRDILAVEAPYRAHDAATVPIVLKQVDATQMISRVTAVVDENPAPVVGEFTFSEAMAPLDFEMRVRVEQYSNVRVISETESGYYMSGGFVKASGGCAAPASGDAAEALASMGKMKLRSFEPAVAMSTPRREAQIMIRHPNYSGLQRDQITQLFIQPHFIDNLEVWQGDELLFSVTA